MTIKYKKTRAAPDKMNCPYLIKISNLCYTTQWKEKPSKLGLREM
jgi:hypothetical protein